MTRIPAIAMAAAGAALLGGGCLSSSRVDRLVQSAVIGKAGAVPSSEQTITDAFQPRAPAAPASAPIALDLSTALTLAARHSRALQTQRERLYLQGLDTLAARRSFGPQYDGTLDYVLAWPSDADRTAEGALKANVSQILPSGGTLALGAGASALTHPGGGTNGTDRYRNTASASLAQPLLQGAGREASHEAETQAERELLYQLRSFTLDRQDFSIGLLGSYFSLLIDQANVVNTRTNLDQAVFLRRRSEAMFSVRKAKIDDVLRARQNELTASNSLLSAEIGLAIKVSRFLVELGLPADTPASLTGHVPEPIPLPLDEPACVALALERRLDLQTERNRREDAERHVRIARNALLPQLDAVGDAQVTGQSQDSATDQDYEHVLSASLRLDLPLDKRAERDALRRRRIQLDQAARALEQRCDEISIEVIESVRRLQVQEQTVRMQRENMSLAERNVRATMLRFKNGEADNLTVVDAQDSLLNANNSYIRALADYAQQRVTLLRNIGLLDVAADGRLIELAADRTSPPRPVFEAGAAP